MTKSIVASEKLAAQSFNLNLTGNTEPVIFNPEQINLDRGMLITGYMGSGKSTAILEVVTHLANAGKSFAHRSTYLDNTFHRFYREDRDFLIRLMDARCAGYSIFNDVHTESDALQLAAALVPHTARSDEAIYLELGRELVADAAVEFLKGSKRSNVEFLSSLVQLHQSENKLVVEAAAFIVDRLRWLQWLPDSELSLTAILATEDSRLFLASREEFLSVENCLHEFILGRVNQIVPTLANKPVVVIDEFGSLPYKPADLAEVLNQQSVPMVIAFQRVDQLRRKLGNAALAYVLQKVGAKLVFRTQESEVQEILGSALDIQEFPDNQGVLSLKGEPARIVKNNPKVYMGH